MIFYPVIKHLLVLSLILMLCLDTNAQAQDRKLIQFSGVVLDMDSIQPVPFVSVANISRNFRGIITDHKGFFSLVVGEGDTIRFSAVGYKNQTYRIPSDLPGSAHTLIVRLKGDTITIPMVRILPWATPEEFKKAFIETDIPDDDLQIARHNLDKMLMDEIAANMKMDGSQNSKYYFNRQSERLYYAGQYAPITVLNPMAWAQFFKLLQEGKISLRNEQ